MSFNRGRVERQHDAVFARLGQRFEDCAPSSSLGPGIEAIVDRRVRAVFTWTITPSCTRLQHVNDPADDAPVVVAIRPRQSRRQMRLDTCPLPIIQPEQPRPHSHAPESKLAGKGITSRYLGTDPSPGSRSPERLLITNPDAGVKPMLVSMLLPSCTAAKLAPLPRWARITRPFVAAGSPRRASSSMRNS